ncbi:MAG: glycogen debranching enzyme, partial [Chloroflexaceae bacterium]|nr:glycogen debranching enzyme [Chloroflexaceae bacterium]
HDGFTLNDLVSYTEKHNEANRENNRDGMNDNLSWNCGVEGPIDDPAIEALRERQIRNFMTILMVSHGTPMIVMGDEVRRTQYGNNNAYALDNELNWFNWNDVKREEGMLHFFRELMRFHRRHQLFREQRFWTDPGGPEITWHGTKLNQPDWNYHSHSLAFELHFPVNAEHLHVMLNAYWEPLTFEMIPLKNGRQWHRAIDTSLPSPDNIHERGVRLPYHSASTMCSRVRWWY